MVAAQRAVCVRMQMISLSVRLLPSTLLTPAASGAQTRVEATGALQKIPLFGGGAEKNSDKSPTVRVATCPELGKKSSLWWGLNPRT